MLKRKLTKIGLFSQGMLLVAFPNGGFQADAAPAASVEIETMSVKTSDHNDETMYIMGSVSDSAEDRNSAELIAPAVRLNPRAEGFVKNYVKKNEAHLSQVKKKSPKYFSITDSVFRRYGIPVEMKYLAVIESGLYLKARSHVGALGPWQFMPYTARELGLRVTKKKDERTHYTKSTVAAALYLRDLYRQYGDWLLVIAAYNAGPGKVNTAIRKSGSRNFWNLQYHLPAETRLHVKRFIGTHYFFEGKGSVTTLTKKEAMEYKKQLEAFEARKVLAAAETNLSEENETTKGDLAKQAPRK